MDKQQEAEVRSQKQIDELAPLREAPKAICYPLSPD